MNVTFHQLVVQYMADINCADRDARAVRLLNERLRSDLRGWSDIVLDAIEEDAWRRRARAFFRHTRECWSRLEDPGATCICRPPAVPEPHS